LRLFNFLWEVIVLTTVDQSFAQRVLIVDDEPTSLMILEGALSDIAEVICSDTGFGAIEKAQQFLPEIILLDIELPDISGLEVCKRLKNDPKTSGVTVIFITSHNESKFEHLSLELGGIDYIQKPVDLKVCRLRVGNHLKLKTQEQQLKHSQRLLAIESERLRVTLNSIGDAVIATDKDEKITFMNPIAEMMTGWVMHEAVGNHISEVMQLRDATTKHKSLNPISIALKEQRRVAMALNCQLTSLNGRIHRVEDSASPIRDEKGNIIGAIIVFHDVSESIAMAVKMSHLANHDQLTDLPNRILLHDRVAHACQVSVRNGFLVALMLIDIDHFKYLNDTEGHHIGDQIIKLVAKRLESIVDLNTTLARVGGDEFVLLLPDIKSPCHVDAVASDILYAMHQPFRVDGREFNLTISVGISINPTDSDSAELMMSHADAAMYKAKEYGRDRFCYFSDDLEHEFHQRQNIDKLLRNALEKDTLEVHFQPKLSLKNKLIIGAEALVRLRDEEDGFISPLHFIPLAEETGLINKLGHSVLKQSCRAAKRWLDKGHPIKVAVNVAAKQFTDPKFIESVAQVLEDTELPSGYLELEVTESALMSDFDETSRILNGLSNLGLSIAIDDFGTGYSSLSYLKLFPVDVLKIDQSFVKDMVDDKQSLDIVKAITHLAHSLNLKIVGEGIETQAQLDTLISLECEEGQGFLFSKALPENEFENLIF
jgi:diguanylate cyclase (GGDEF)-like protein/PAS domain S-box-containing protein